MVTECVSLKELREEVAAMLAVCFEGKIVRSQDDLVFTLPNGQSFRVRIEEH